MTSLRAPVGSSLPEKLAFFSIPEPNSGCLLWLGPCTWNGYGIISVSGRKTRAHRASWMCAHGDIPPQIEVCHKCDVPSCINPDHLFLGTRQDNVTDKVRKGRTARGSLLPFSKLTPDAVRAIRDDPRISRVVAADFGVSPSAIRTVRTRRGWAWVSEDLA